MKEAFFDCGGFATHALVWNEAAASSRLVLVIPGNPGVARFYSIFAAQLAAALPGACVCVAGHAGHDQKRSIDGGAFVGLAGQVTHKESVINRYLGNSGGELILVGHSVGSFIAMELQARLKVLFVAHLCPTFSFIREGLSPVVKVIVLHSSLTWVLANMVHYLPVAARKALVSLLSHDTEEVQLVLEEHLDFYCARNILAMAAEESVQIRELRESHVETMRRNRERSFFVFSQIDQYVPLSYVDELKRRVGGELDIVIAPPDVEHAFVLRHAEWMAEKVRSFFSNNYTLLTR